MKARWLLWIWCLLLNYTRVIGDTVVVSYFDIANIDSPGLLLRTTSGLLDQCFVAQNLSSIVQSRVTNFITFTCVFVYETEDCSGRSVQLTEFDGHSHAKQVNFTVKSFQPCKVGQRDPLHDERKRFYEEAYNDTKLFRALYLSPPLTLSSDLNSAAQDIADVLSSQEAFTRPSQTSFGMNIAYAAKPNEVASVAAALGSWFNQGFTYDVFKPEFSVETQHFTQLVWKSSELFGVGASWNEQLQVFVVVALYSPKGNVDGLYFDNVKTPFLDPSR